MKLQLALQLLQEIIPELGDEDAAVKLFRELQWLAEYKYNGYEMYHPGRLFLESLYLWLKQFDQADRSVALSFVLEKLIFVSRIEFQQLAEVLFEDRIKRIQLRVAAGLAGIPHHRIRAIYDSTEFAHVAASSLYVGMSDGSRIDYIRRHNLEIDNEQVLPYYETSDVKVDQMLGDLRRKISKPGAKFQCLFLIDDFCGSGRTLLREVARSQIKGPYTLAEVPTKWASRIRVDPQKCEIEFQAEQVLSSDDEETLRSMGSGAWMAAVDVLIQKVEEHNTELKGALTKVSNGAIAKALAEDAQVFYCPLLLTDHAKGRLVRLVRRLRAPFSELEILSAACLDESVKITSSSSPIGLLCEKYYSDAFEDEHTGCVKFGYGNCGLPLVLHHNTPNNSIYPLWSRKLSTFRPLFPRYERHGRERV